VAVLNRVGGACAGAGIDGLAFKVQGPCVVRVQDGQGLLSSYSGNSLADDFADALVVAAVQEGDLGVVAVQVS
jgi:hypothetical protein